jgi:hypothetical protein
VRRPTSNVLTALVAAVIGATLLIVLFLRLATSPDAKQQLAKPTFEVGNAAALAAEVDRNGPLLFHDPLGHGRDIFLVHHAGTAWEAFEARRPDGCRIVLDRATRRLRDCHGHRVTATAIAGLRHYRVTVDGKGRLVVDLRATTATTSTTTTLGSR